MNTADHQADLEALMAYLDGELAGVEAGRVRAHLSTCERCQRVEAEMRAVSERLQTWQVEGAPATLAARAPGSRTSGLRRWMPVAAALVITTGAAIGWLSQQRYSSSVDRVDVMAPEPSPARGAVGGRAAVAAPTDSSVRRAPEASIQGITLGGAPLLARTARLTIVTDQFDRSRADLDALVRTLGGFAGRILVTGTAEQGRALTATLQIPSGRLDEALAGIKALGRVESEGVDGEDVTQQSVDLDARLANGRTSEKRLTAILANRTGDLDDVLAVEREIARVRGEIESMEAQRKALDRRITYARVELQLTEDKRATVDLGPQPLSTRFADEFVNGWNGVLIAGVEIGLVAARVAPALMLLGLVVTPWLLWRRLKSTTGL